MQDDPLIALILREQAERKDEMDALEKAFQAALDARYSVRWGVWFRERSAEFADKLFKMFGNIGRKAAQDSIVDLHVCNDAPHVCSVDQPLADQHLKGCGLHDADRGQLAVGHLGHPLIESPDHSTGAEGDK